MEATIDRSDGDIFTLTRSDGIWPEGLRSIDAPPTRLWARGRGELLLEGPRVAIVGSRAPTPYGVAQAERFGSALAARGVTVVSGLARGIDEAAHRGALRVGGPSIAVLGCGVDRPWPAGPLAKEMARDGLLLSEFPPGTAPRRHHFPLRNRIIAALSDAVLVVEAAEVSGSLITARWAADQGQDVFVLPGRIDHPMALGTLRLAREGAMPVGSPAMLLDDLYGLICDGDEGDGPARRTDPIEARVLDALLGETLPAAEVARRASLDLGEALATLATLELEGAVRRCPGGLFTR